MDALGAAYEPFFDEEDEVHTLEFPVLHHPEKVTSTNSTMCPSFQAIGGVKGHWIWEDGRCGTSGPTQEVLGDRRQLSDGSLGALAMWAKPSPNSCTNRFQKTSLSSSVRMMSARCPLHKPGPALDLVVQLGRRPAAVADEKGCSAVKSLAEHLLDEVEIPTHAHTFHDRNALRNVLTCVQVVEAAIFHRATHTDALSLGNSSMTSSTSMSMKLFRTNPKLPLVVLAEQDNLSAEVGVVQKRLKMSPDSGLALLMG